MKQIICENVSLGYEGTTVATGINFEVNEGEYLCIVGENGSGKTTLLKAILGLQNPVDGKIEFVNGLTRKDIGYLPQQTIVQRDFPASVREIVQSGCQGRLGFRPFYSKSDKALAAKNIEKMGIADLTSRSYRELSGGQQQRVLLARALCATGKLLILDEPVSGLDPKVTAELYKIIKELNEEGITIVMISHDIEAAVEYASHILHVGHNNFFGTKEEYLISSEGKSFISGITKGEGEDE